MNAKLVESLADAIAALPTEDYALFQEALITKIVKKTPGVAGGCACLRDTRIAVWTIISLKNQGADEQVLATATADNRCVITFNCNDFIGLHRSGVEHKGIVICKDDRDRLLQAQIIDEELSAQATIENRLFRVLKQNQLGSNQPKLAIQEYLRL